MDPSLAALAEMLKRTQGQRVRENAPGQSVTIKATPPPLPAYSNVVPSLDILRSVRPGTPPINPAATPPPMAAAAPPMTAPAIAPGNQPGVVPPMPPPVNINGAGAGDASTPGFWERFNQAIKAQQVPPIYQGAMGQIIGNS